MIDLSQWRARIGGWNSHSTSYCCPSSSSNKISAVGVCLGALAVLSGCQVMMSLLSVVLGLRLILMLSGDIELNPGPDCALQVPLSIITIVSLLLILAGDVETNPGPITVGELVDALKDLVNWETFAIHLPMISSSDIEKIAKDYKTTDTQKFHLYSLWLNHCPNASWNDVVQALHKTGNHAMAGEIEEEGIIQGHKLQPTAPMEFSSKSASTNNDQLYPIIPSLPPCLTRYSGLLKHKYKDQHVVTSAEWPPRVGKDYYGKLVLLDNERRDTETEQRKIWNTMRGNIDILPKVTQSRLVDISDVLKSDSSAILLIDGPPGVGKTTFGRKLLNMWANGQLPTDQQNRYTVVLYCSLRDKRITGANTLTDIMKACYANRDTDLVSQYIDEHDGDGLLIIFDGWDELSMEHRESSLAVKFIRREILLKCTVIVTSRSYASQSIMELNENYRHFEVIGFEKTELPKVIKETLHDDVELASNLVKELESQSNIESLCYIPLVCSMVILVYKDLKHLPSRLTELYKKFILHAVKRHVKKSSTISTDPKQIRSLNHLPSCITTAFAKLCHFAYLSLKENNPKMTFSLPELQEAVDISVAEGYIGLMTTVSVYDEELYQFPHLTIQEFLAAWWIANNDGMDVKAFEEHFEDDHFRMCLRFVAGLTRLKNETFKEMKHFNMQLDLRCTRYHHQYSIGLHYCSHDQFSIRKHSCDNLISTDIPQRLFHLLYESNSTELCKHIANTCVVDSSFCFERFCGRRPDFFDMSCVLFFLHSCGITWSMIHLRIGNFVSPLPELIMVDSCTDVIKCKELIIICGCVTRPTRDFIEPVLDKILHLFSSDNIRCKCKCCDCINALLKIPQIKLISIVAPKQLDESVIKNLETSTTLEELNIFDAGSFLNVIPDPIVMIIDGVIRNKSIKSLKVNIFSDLDEINEFDYSALSRNLKQLLKDNTTLEEIKLGIRCPYDIFEINSPLRSVRCSWLKPTEIESVLTRCQHLQSLTIDVDHFHQPVRILITNLFSHLPKLRELCVHSLVDGDSELLAELFTILQTNQTLKELMIHSKAAMIMDDEVLLSLKNCVIYNTSIKHLGISRDVKNYVPALTEGLSSNKTIEQLSLWIDITSDDVRSLSNSVLKIESLMSLKLELKGECIDGADLYSFITSLLHKNSHIKELHIHTNETHESLQLKHSELAVNHFEELIKTIYNHPTLEYACLDLCIEPGAVGVLSHLRRIFEQDLYKKQISNYFSPHTKIPPLIELSHF